MPDGTALKHSGAVSAADRRRFLSQAVLGSATALSVGALATVPRWAGRHTGHRLPPKTADPGFAEGKIVGIHGPRLTVAGSDLLIQRIQVSDATDIWKLRHGVSLDQVEVGDALYARGQAGPDGLFVADAVWVNIVNLHVIVTGTEPGRLHLDHAGGRLLGNVVPGTTTTVDRLARLTPGVSGLRIGSHVQVVAAWRPGSNEIDIATILG